MLNCIPIIPFCHSLNDQLPIASPLASTTLFEIDVHMIEAIYFLNLLGLNKILTINLLDYQVDS